MVMKVYGDEMSASMARVLLCLHAKNIEFELHPVNLFACDHKLLSFLSMNLIVVPLQGESPDAAVVEGNLEKLGKVLDVYEERLGKAKYLAGDSYTLAGLYHVPYTCYCTKTTHAGLVNDRITVKAWWQDLCSRPAFLKVSPGLTVAPATN